MIASLISRSGSSLSELMPPSGTTHVHLVHKHHLGATAPVAHLWLLPLLQGVRVSFLFPPFQVTPLWLSLQITGVTQQCHLVAGREVSYLILSCG